MLQRNFKEQAPDKDWIDMIDGKVDTAAQQLLSRQIAMIPPHVPSVAFSLAGDSNKAGLDKQKPEDCAYLRKV